MRAPAVIEYLISTDRLSIHSKIDYMCVCVTAFTGPCYLCNRQCDAASLYWGLGARGGARGAVCVCMELGG